MVIDRVQEALLEALKRSLAEPGDQRLYRSGKLDGLLPSRAGVNAEAAAQAVKDGLLEVRRTETKGKTLIEWVRITPRGVEFLHEHESPRRALEDLRHLLQTSSAQLPGWLDDFRQQIDRLTKQVAEEAQRWTHRLETLSQRVEEALKRAEILEAEAAAEGAGPIPWASDALTYLERRRGTGATGECPLPELFAALRQRHADLAIPAFHEGLRRLQDRQVMRLLPYTAEPETLPEPEYALPNGEAVLYYVAR